MTNQQKAQRLGARKLTTYCKNTLELADASMYQAKRHPGYSGDQYRAQFAGYRDSAAKFARESAHLVFMAHPELREVPNV